MSYERRRHQSQHARRPRAHVCGTCARNTPAHALLLRSLELKGHARPQQPARRAAGASSRRPGAVRNHGRGPGAARSRQRLAHRHAARQSARTGSARCALQRRVAHCDGVLHEGAHGLRLWSSLDMPALRCRRAATAFFFRVRVAAARPSPHGAAGAVENPVSVSGRPAAVCRKLAHEPTAGRPRKIGHEVLVYSHALPAELMDLWRAGRAAGRPALRKTLRTPPARGRRAVALRLLAPRRGAVPRRIATCQPSHRHAPQGGSECAAVQRVSAPVEARTLACVYLRHCAASASSVWARRVRLRGLTDRARLEAPAAGACVRVARAWLRSSTHSTEPLVAQARTRPHCRNAEVSLVRRLSRVSAEAPDCRHLPLRRVASAAAARRRLRC